MFSVPALDAPPGWIVPKVFVTLPVIVPAPLSEPPLSVKVHRC
jgi:hypothetical protein